MFVVEAMNGPLDGKRWPFSADITVGRDAQTVQAALPTDRTVSRRHAVIRVAGKAFELADLGSSNGTLVDGKPIDGSVRIAIGQPFLIGRTMLCVLDVPDDAVSQDAQREKG